MRPREIASVSCSTLASWPVPATVVHKECTSANLINTATCSAVRGHATNAGELEAGGMLRTAARQNSELFAVTVERIGKGTHCSPASFTYNLLFVGDRSDHHE